jgi:ligand-binding sensor domain-containing protein
LNSLSDRWITSIVEDKEGYLWIGTRLGGLNRYNPRADDFVHFLHDDQNPSSLTSNQINVLYLDTNDDLWIGTPKGIDLFDRANNGFKHRGFNPSQRWDVSKKNVTAIYEDRTGRFWVSIR